MGWAMRLAGHVTIRRASKKSQLETFKQAIWNLQNGNTLVAFAEGTRTRDGHLKRFKKGPFTMAKTSKVRVVPVSICNLWKWMPTAALMPLGRPNDVIVKIHPPISTDDLTTDEIMTKTFAAVNNGLPEYQKYQQPN